MGSLAACVIADKAGLEPIYTLSCRDRNRLAACSDLLGAHALGIRNVLCVTGDYFNFSGWMNPSTAQIDALFESGTIFGAQGKGPRMLGLPFDAPLQHYKNKPIQSFVWRVLNRLFPPTEIQLIPTCEDWFLSLSRSTTTPFCLSHTLWGDFKAYKNNKNYTEMTQKSFFKNIKYGLYSYGYIHDYSMDKQRKKSQTQGIHLKDQIVETISFLVSQNEKIKTHRLIVPLIRLYDKIL